MSELLFAPTWMVLITNIRRKKPWMLARILGLKFILKFLMGTLTIDELQERVEELFGVKARAIISSYPEIATDVDKDSDFELAARALT